MWNLLSLRVKTTSLMTHNISRLYRAAINLGINEEIPHQEQKKLRITNLILLISTIIPFNYIVLALLVDIPEMIPIQLVISLISFGAYRMNGGELSKVSMFILLYVIPTLLLYFPLFVGDIGGEFFYYIFIVIGFYLMDKMRHALILALYLFLLLLFAKYAILNIQHPPKFLLLEAICYYPNIFISAFLIALSTFLFKYDTVRYQSIIEEQSVELNKQVVDLEAKDRLSSKLFKELNHRVKNNLQMVSSLFSMQVYKHKNQETVQALNRARNRIDSIAILHQYMYQKEKLPNPSLKKYIQKLAEYVAHASGFAGQVELQLEVEKTNRTIEETTHIGLIVNELLTNSFKYGMNPQLGENLVKVEIKRIKDGLLILVSDSGCGFPKGFELTGDNSFGLELVSTIAMQYNGELKVYNEQGAVSSVFLALD